MFKNKKNIYKSTILSVVKGSFIAIAVSLVYILFFAFIVKLFGLSDSSLKIVNQIIKALSILIGTFFGLKHKKEKGLLLGLSIGLIYTMMSFVVFSALNGNFVFGKSILNDIIFGGITGAICGVVCVNLKNNSKKTA